MKDETDFLAYYVNKRVEFRFSRQTLHFDLSQSLFSSYDIDVGTRLLLKTIAKEIRLDDLASVLDVGCGVGVLGLCLKKVNPTLAVTLQDRDALAVAFTEMNARLNKIEDVTLQRALALQGVEDRQFDLIVANLPGKAGQPVLDHILGRIPAYLTPTGIGAVVIVRPLAERVTAMLSANDSEVLYVEEAKGHTVFHFRGGLAAETADPLLPYLRGRYSFQIAGASFTLATAFNLPEFDTPGYATSLAINTLGETAVSGRILVWNPGQGHLPVYLSQANGPQAATYTLAGRDLLSLLMTRRNLLAQGVPESHVAIVHLPHFLAATGSFDWLLIFPDFDPGVPWADVLLPHSAGLLPPGSYLLLAAKSVHVFRLLTARHPFRVRADKKRRGFRAILLQK